MERSRLLAISARLLLCLSAVWVPAAAAAAAGVPAARRPAGCRTSCGGVDVPYPFGMDDPRCAIHGGFELQCKDVNGTAKLLYGDIEVSRISVADGKAWMMDLMSRQCYDPATNGMTYNGALANLTGSPYYYSAQDNKIMVTGCNSLAYIHSDRHISGCSSTCSNVEVKNGSCSGAGCCQADVPKGVQYYKVFFNENYNTSSDQRWRGTPCSYVALMEAAAFSFSTTYLTSTAFYDEDSSRQPVVLDWVISRKTCEEARADRSVPYACVSNNSDCLTNDSGYRCKCSSGYRGNPYIVDGCTDIDECVEKATLCAGICKNTAGSFDCTCPRGKHMMDGNCVPSQKSIWVMPVVGATVGFVVLVITATCMYLIRERRKLQRIKRKYFRQHGGMLLFEEMKSQQGFSFKIFSEEELQQATSNFDEQRVLGHGGHGTVYMGVLKSDVEVAVKRCMTIDEQQKKEFGKEMLILSQINHRNIVKLLGCCLEVEVPILVYEFVPNGTLFQLIHGSHGGGRHVSLATRLRIAHESADALAYLHSCASPPILHGDVKSSNILLDGDHTAKVSDFGASILAPNDESQFVTLVQGTCGYLDPEYMQTCQLTDKSDVYSFGVVLLELLTRKKAFNLDGPEHDKSLSMRVLSAMKQKRLEDVLDDQIKDDESMEFLEEIAELARQCLEMSGENRPSMKEVAEKLGRLRKVMQHPWVQQDPEELDSLLGESSMITLEVGSTRNFSIEKKAVSGLQSGR